MGKTKRVNMLKKSSLSHTKIAKPKPENPFDKFANARKKHDILNRKVKGEDRNVGRARAKAIDERKKKLLTELHQSKRSNQIIDKRFGENDPTISLEEKMFMRFQVERVKKVRNSSMYNLDEENTEFLTHKGNILGESNLQDPDWHSDDDDEEANGKIHKDVVSKLHFGGGLVPKKSQDVDKGGYSDDAASAEHPVKKSRLDALQEIVMKSKYYKMQRKEAKDDQEVARKRLDTEFDELFASHIVEYDDAKKPKKKNLDIEYMLSSLRSASRIRDIDQHDQQLQGEIKEEEEEVDDYDRMMREMMYEPKVQPSDRLKSSEELAIESKERLEALEKARLHRMKRVSLNATDLEDLKQANKRKRNDDELDDIDFGKNRREKMNNLSRNDCAEEEEINENIEENEFAHVFDEDRVDESDSENEIDEDDELSEDEQGEEEEEMEDDEEGAALNSDSSEEFDEEGEEVVKSRIPFHQRNRKSSSFVPPIPTREEGKDNYEMMPHKIVCPNDILGFDDLILQYCRSVEDQLELIRRIISWNNIHLPGGEGKENKHRMHNFLNILIKHFIRLGDSIPSCNSEVKLADTWKELDALTGSIFQITQDLQQSCIPLYSRTIRILYDQFQKSIRDYQLGEQSSCFLSLGKLLFFQLIAHLFSVSDIHNPIVNVSILILSQQLTQCPVNTMEEVYLGAITCSILLSSYNSFETKKLMPEVIPFLSSTLLNYVPKLSKQFPSRNPEIEKETEKGQSPVIADSLVTNLYYNKEFYQSWKHVALNNFKYSQLSEIRKKLSEHHHHHHLQGACLENQKSSTSKISEEILSYRTIHWKYLSSTLKKEGEEANLSEEVLLLIYYLLQKRIIPYYSSYSGFSELLSPVLYVLQQLSPHQPPVLSEVIQSVHYEVLQSLTHAITVCQQSRLPLRWREKQLQAVESKTPKYHMNYIIKRDREEYDQENKERLQLKQLNRQLKREQKAAMRELRRDAAFIDEERYKESEEKKTKLRNERNKNYQWLEEQQATINEQVKSGKGLMKGGGSFVAKKPRVKR